MPRNRSWVILATRVRTLSGDSLRALATRGIWNSAAAGVISGGGHWPRWLRKSTGSNADGFSALSFSASSLTRSTSARLVAPRFDPAEFAELYGAGTVFAESFGSVSAISTHIEDGDYLRVRDQAASVQYFVAPRLRKPGSTEPRQMHSPAFRFERHQSSV